MGSGLSGCASLGYYWQSVSGHLQMLNAAKPVPDLLQDPGTPDSLKQRLLLSQRIRSFAVTELKLPDNASYRGYADLQRSAVVWNVVAAPAFSLKPRTWCFPVAGCVAYRGYFSEADARREADALKARGLEVSVYGVPAYSTLGWMNWAGGDPLLNTFIRYPEGELARIIFHELAHQVVYASGDTRFNESFATTVERLGGERWLAAHGSEAARQEYAVLNGRRREFKALLLATRRELAELYGESVNGQEIEPEADSLDARIASKSQANQAVAHKEQADAAAILIAKDRIMQNFRDHYAKLRAGWGGYAGYDRWAAGANNAAFAVHAAYDDLVPGFEALFERGGQDWARFYEAVRRLSKMPKTERRMVLGVDAIPP